MTLVLAAVTIGGCKGDDSDQEKTGRITGIAGFALFAQGSPALDASVRVSGTKVTPDAAGAFRLIDLIDAGQHRVSVTMDGHVSRSAHIDVETGMAAATQLRLAELSTLEFEDSVDGGSVNVDDMVLHVPGEALANERGDIVRHGVSWSYLTANEDNVQSVPNPRDGGGWPLSILGALYLEKPTRGDEIFELVEEVELRWTPEEIPEGLGLYQWGGQAWAHVQDVDIDGTEVSAMLTTTGWWALAYRPAELGCVAGFVADSLGQPVEGAEVIATPTDLRGATRVYTDRGDFCVDVEPGPLRMQVLGNSSKLDALFTASFDATVDAGTSSCEARLCTELGTLEVRTHLDADEDGYFADAGDCDDSSPSVNPTLHFGDGSLCYADALQ